MLSILFICFIAHYTFIYFTTRKYIQIENDYLGAAAFIYENNAIEDGTSKEKIILTRNEMNKFLKDPITSFECNGYVEIYPSNQGPTYKVFIQCKDYITKGFKQEHLS